MATDADLGVDWGGVDDIGPGLDEVSGRMALLQCVARSWLDLAGSLFYDRNYGKGLALWLSGAVQSSSALESALEDEARKDERVATCKVAVSYVDEVLTISGRITDNDGPFTFTTTIGNLSTTVLLENSIQ